MATDLVDAKYFQWLQGFDWCVMGRSIFYVERTTVTYIKRRLHGSKRRYGYWRVPAKSRWVNLHHEVFLKSEGERVGPWQSVCIPKGKHIDHRNRSAWDNRSANLRPSSPSENCHNRPKPKSGSSQYKGVSKVKGKDKWKAQIKLQGKHYNLGTFDDEFQAAQAYNAFVRKNIPEFGYINPLVIKGV